MTHTAKEVRELAKQGTDALQLFINGQHSLHVPPRDTDTDFVMAKCLSIVDAYADLLERREAGVTDEVVAKAAHAYLGNRVGFGHGCDLSQLRDALEAVWPVAAEPVGKLSDMPIGSTIRCRKCGEQTAIAFNYAGGTGECCNHSPCAHPGVGPCDRPAEPAQPAGSGRVTEESAEDRFEQYVKSLIDNAPDVQKLGERLAHLLDDDQFNNIEPTLLGIAAALAAQGQGAERDEIAEEAWRAFYEAADKVQGQPAKHTHPIATDDDVENLAALCGWDNRHYMTPADYSIWCQRMRKFVSLATQPAERVPEVQVDLQSHVMRTAVAHGGLRQLSRNLGIDVGYLSRLANGERTEPGEEILAKLGLEKRVTYLSKQAAFMRDCEQESQSNG